MVKSVAEDCFCVGKETWLESRVVYQRCEGVSAVPPPGCVEEPSIRRIIAHELSEGRQVGLDFGIVRFEI